MSFLRRFAAVGSMVTICDLGVYLAARGVAGWSWLAANVAALSVAAVVSHLAHRSVTFADSPDDRWYSGVLYLPTVVFAAAADMAVVGLSERTMALSGWTIAASKVVAIGVGFVVRVTFYRWHMFGETRAGQSSPGRPLTGDPDIRLSVVIPAFDEEGRIGPTLSRIRDELSSLGGRLEVVVVDDGSSDDTSGAARRAGADLVLTQPENRGKGAAVRAGMLAAGGRVVAFTDADLAYAPRQLLTLLDKVEDGWDVVVGSRKHTETQTLVAARRLREVGGRVVNLLTMMVLLGQYRDTQCGIKAFRSDVATLIFERSKVDRFGFDVEVFHLAERYRLSLVEVPVEVVNSSRSTVNVVRDAVRLVVDLFRIRGRSRRGEYE